MTKLENLIYQMKLKLELEKDELEKKGGDGPDWMWIDGYDKAIKDMEIVINRIKEVNNG